MRGDMHLLREMVRTKNFHPVDQATLPFQPPPDGQWDVDPLQTKRCSMANLFNLELESFSSDAPVFQSRVTMVSGRSRPVPPKKKTWAGMANPSCSPRRLNSG